MNDDAENVAGASGAVLADDIEDVLRYTRGGRPGDEKIIVASVDFPRVPGPHWKRLVNFVT